MERERRTATASQRDWRALRQSGLPDTGGTSMERDSTTPVTPQQTADDAYSRVDYRRMIAWPARIEREWPFLQSVLGTAPNRRLLDLGCGTGEHSRFLAAKGFDVVGIDSSPAMITKARDGGAQTGVRFIEGDIAALGESGRAGVSALPSASAIRCRTSRRAPRSTVCCRACAGSCRQAHPSSCRC